MAKTPKHDVPERLEREARVRVWRWCQEKYPDLERMLGELWDECRDWHIANGAQRSDFEAAFRNWIRRHARYEGERVKNMSSKQLSRHVEAIGKRNAVELEVIAGGLGGKR